jgi:hypothetical protein
MVADPESAPGEIAGLALANLCCFYGTSVLRTGVLSLSLPAARFLKQDWINLRLIGSIKRRKVDRF